MLQSIANKTVITVTNHTDGSLRSGEFDAVLAYLEIGIRTLIISLRSKRRSSCDMIANVSLMILSVGKRGLVFTVHAYHNFGLSYQMLG